MDDLQTVKDVLNLFGWPLLFIFGLAKGWWHMGAGVDPSWKEVALRSISANEELATRQAKARRKLDA